MDVTKKWNDHLRRVARKSKPAIRCPVCSFQFQTVENPQDGVSADVAFASFRAHFSDCHAQLLDEKATEKEKMDLIQVQWETAQAPGDTKDGDKPDTSSPEASQRLPKTAVAGEGVQPFPSRPSNRIKPGGTSPPAGAAPGRKSPTPPSIKREGSRSRSVSPPKRSKARAAATPAGEESRAEFDRGTFQKAGRLWSPDDDATASRGKSKVPYQRQRPPSASLPKPPRQPQTRAPEPPATDDPTELIKQPETRPISQEQLVAEVKGIYAGLVMVESKCIEVDNNQSSQTDPANKLNNDQWQALIALHRTLLHEHHDFFLASQHPSASPALRRLAAKYAMPARMWRHGIHSFLELLRHRLPASLDHMLTFIYMAYSMMALLYETVPAFEDTWIECLGDLGRYRMAIEDDDIRDREVWTAVSRHWYSRASDKAPTTGRLYHHLAILARPNALQQLYYYNKSLCVEMPFLSARESIMTLYEPIMARASNPQQTRLPPTELNFVKTHGIMFSGKQLEELDPTMEAFFQVLDNHIGRSTRRWLESGYHMAIANICAVTGYGDEHNPIAAALKAFSRLQSSSSTTTTDSQDQPPAQQDTAASETTASGNNTKTAPATGPSTKQLPNALRLLTGTYDIVCRRFGDLNTLPFLHVSLAFVHHLTFCPDAMALVAPHFPWKLTASMLNTLLNGSAAASAAPNVSVQSSAGAGLARLLDSELFPGTGELKKEVKEEVKEVKEEVKKEGGEKEVKKEGGEKEKGAAAAAAAAAAAGRRRRPLPDDYAMQGFPWVEKYYPDKWFVTEEKIDDDEKYFELASMLEERRERVLWLGCRIAEREGGKWLRFDKEAKRFGVHPDYEVELELPGQTPATPGESVEYGELPDAGTVA